MAKKTSEGTPFPITIWLTLIVRPTTNTNIGFALPKVFRPPAAIIAQVSKP